MLINKDLDQIKVSATQPNTGEEVWIQKGKNLFNKNNIIVGKRVGNTGTLVTDANYYSSEFIEALASTTYTLSKTGTPTSPAYCCYAFYDNSKTFISRSDFYTTTNVTFTTPANTKYIMISEQEYSLNTLQIEQGSSATTYEPYISKKIYTKNSDNIYEEFYDENAESIWVKTSNNILSLKDAKDITISGVTFTVDKTNGTITANGTSTEQIKYYITGDSYGDFPLENGRYRLSGCPSGGSSSNGYRLQIQDANTFTYGGNDTGYGLIFNGKDGYKFYVRIVIDSGKTVSNLVFYPQLVKGETQLGFHPYETKKLYVKNDNNIYDLFYEEPLIGGYMPEGGYIAYPDGTIIQYGAVSMTTGTTSYTRGGMTYFASDSITINLPLPYTTAGTYTAFAQVQGADTGSFNYMYVNNVGSRILGLRFLSTSSNYTRTISWYTIGKTYK